VVESDRFFADPAPVYDRVLDFLRLPRLARVSRPEFIRHNARPRSAPLHPRLRAELTAYFAPHDEHLAHWLGRPPCWRAE
jgi:hypothetical protein